MRTNTTAAAARYARATLLSVSFIGSGLLTCGVHGAVAPGTMGLLLYTGVTFILCGILTWTLAAYVYDRATEANNGTQTETVHAQG